MRLNLEAPPAIRRKATTVLIDDTDSANESAEETNTENGLVSSLNLRPKVCPVNLYNSNVWPFEVVLRTLC